MEEQKEIITKQPKLNMLSAIKFTAMFLLIWWHIELENPKIDIGARMCELLFIASGFLVAYNAFYKTSDDSWAQSFKYVFKKIATIWPIYLIALFSIIYLKRYDYDYNQTWFINLFIHIFMLQAWFNNGAIYFGFNGVSWFVSAIMFCYFLSPLFLKFTKKIKISVVLFIIISVIRILLEMISRKFWFFSLQQNIHVSPICRSLEYFMGMLLVPLFMFIKNKLHSFNIKHKNWSCFIFSIVEVASILIMILLLKKYDNRWIRGYYVIAICIFVFLISFDYGIFSKLFSLKPFQWLFALQLEMYILQIANNIAFNRLIMKIAPSLFGYLYWYVAIEIAMLILISWIYHKFIAQYLTKVCNKIFSFVGGILKNSEKV